MLTGQYRKNKILLTLFGAFFIVFLTSLCLLSAASVVRGADAKTAAPTFQPNSGIYITPQNVRINCATPHATIRYTTDGSTPNASSPIYNGPISIDKKTIIKAYALLDGSAPSAFADARYDIVVAAPTFNPPPRVSDKPIRVSLLCMTPRAVIRYTTDGSNPSEASAVYNGPINIENTTTVKAYAVSSTAGPTDSKVVVATYTINSAKTAAPVFSPPARTYSQPQSVGISCATPGATIRYTVNGGNPNPASDIYTGPISVDKNITIKAYAVANGCSDSTVVTANYKIVLAKVDTPKFSPMAGAYPPPLSVTISCATPGATIRYTTDGSNPNASSNQYNGPISVDQNTIIKAYASANGYVDSMIAVAKYQIAQNKAELPTFIPTPGTYSEPQRVAITCGTPGATIRYTIGGSTPNTSSPIYHEPIIVDKNTIIKAYVTANGFADSAVAAAGYKIVSDQVETPTFNPKGGTYAAPQSVIISCATPGAAIRYTTDGSNPSASSTFYNGPILVDQNKTIKAFASVKGLADSAVATASYTIKVTPNNAATPTPTPSATNTPAPQGTISFTTPTANETIMVGSAYSLRWTLQGNPGPLKLLLQESGGYSTTLTTIVDAAAKLWPWTVTPPPDPYQKYRILAYSDDGRNVGSSNYFRFQYPTITVTAPKSGQTLQAGIPAAISWTYQPQNGTLKIELVRMSDNQVFDPPIASNIKLNQYVINWPPPTNKPASFYGQQYKIRITNVNLDFYGESEPFVITAPIPDPSLTRAEIIFNTTHDNKEANTAVSVHVTGNFIVAWVENNIGTEFRANFGYTLPLTCDTNTTKSECSNLKVSVGARIPAPYWDTWSFYSTVILYFSDGSQIIKRYPAERIFNLMNGNYVVIDL